MKLRIRHANVTKLLTLEDGRSYTIGQVKCEIKSQIITSLGLEASTNFTLSLNGSAALGGDGVDINQAGVVGGDLLKILLLPQGERSPEVSSGASQSTNRNRSTTQQTSNTSAPQGRAQRDYSSARAAKLKSMYDMEAVRSPYHAMCVWIHSLMLDGRFGSQLGSHSELANALRLPVLHLEYNHPDAPETMFTLTVTQLGPFVLINGIVRPCRNTEPQVISLQVKLSDYISNFTSKPAYTERTYKHRDRMAAIFKSEIANKAVNAMRAELNLPPLGGLLILPPEMLLKVFTYLEAPALCTLAQTCKSLQQVTGDNSLWESLFHRSFASSPSPSHLLPWKEVFKQEYVRQQREQQERREYERAIPMIPPNPFAPNPNVPIVMPYPGQPLGMLGGDYDLDPGFPYGPLARQPRRNPFGPTRPHLPGNPLPGSRFDPMYPGGRFRPGRGGGMFDDGW